MRTWLIGSALICAGALICGISRHSAAATIVGVALLFAGWVVTGAKAEL